LLRNLDELLRNETKLPIHISEDPLSAVAVGAGKALSNLSILRGWPENKLRHQDKGTKQKKEKGERIKDKRFCVFSFFLCPFPFILWYLIQMNVFHSRLQINVLISDLLLKLGESDHELLLRGHPVQAFDVFQLDRWIGAERAISITGPVDPHDVRGPSG